MNTERFTKIIEARADQRVQDKIRKFRNAVYRAAEELTGVNEQYYMEGYGPVTKSVVDVACTPKPRKWPVSLWEKEEAAVQKELFSIMDEMQKALLAADNHTPGEERPALASKPEVEG